MRSACMLALATILLVAPTMARSQPPGKSGLRKELDLLQRENELLKRENELLKQEIAQLRKGGAVTPGKPDSSVTVTVGNVEYVYQGTTRNGTEMWVTLLAKSIQGENTGPVGQMFLIDEDGNKYDGMPKQGFGAPEVLREGVPVKLVWRFGPNPLTKQGSAPPAKIKRFASLAVESGPSGPIAVEFRDLPAVVPQSQRK